MLAPEAPFNVTASTPAMAAAVQDLLTRGWTVMTKTVSDRLRRKVREGGSHVSYRHVRQLFDGSPQRVATQLLGRCVFAGMSVPPSKWARGRPDIVASGVPRDFIPGLDIYAPVEEATLSLDLAAGSARLREGEALMAAQIQNVAIAPGDLVLLDVRALRRTAEQAPRCLCFSVVREWICPVEVWPAAEMEMMPPRAAAFFGRHAVPSTSIADWLLRTHGRRT